MRLLLNWTTVVLSAVIVASFASHIMITRSVIYCCTFEEINFDEKKEIISFRFFASSSVSGSQIATGESATMILPMILKSSLKIWLVVRRSTLRPTLSAVWCSYKQMMILFGDRSRFPLFHSRVSSSSISHPLLLNTYSLIYFMDMTRYFVSWNLIIFHPL